ncbi:MAG TPA: CoA pyrophosphatase [Acidimicrobiales bacterium]|nr:CoA pyrophosphatase [Acidimicrobiales bacterium]
MAPARFEGRPYPQRVPVPPFRRPGRPAPWAALSASQRRPIPLSRVVDAVAARTAPARTDEAGRHGAAPSAILVALFEVAGEARVVLTRRSMDLRAHRGEVALPGGRGEAHESPWATALREAEEEVGLDPSAVEHVGRLSDLSTIAMGTAIVPVVGALAQPPALTPAPGEVDRVFSAALSDLAADDAFLEERWRREAPRPGADDEGFFPIQFVYAEGELVWGATARVLTELLSVALGVDTPRH